MPARVALVEFPADDPERARGFWGSVLSTPLQPRAEDQGEGWVTRPDSDAPAEPGAAGAAVGIHSRGKGPGDSFSLPYIEVDDLPAVAGRVEQHGGTVIHPGERWTICKDSEGNPFALAAAE